MRRNVETARALESLPKVTAAAHAGELSDEQLSSVVKLADEDSDAEWARRGPNIAPEDLARLARTKTKPTAGDSRVRHHVRGLRMWWTPDTGMLRFRGQLPDLMGATFEATIQRLAEEMRPASGQAWDTFEHRAADALVRLWEQPEGKDVAPTAAARPLVQVLVPPHTGLRR